jgi:hypothetical protein
MRVEHLQKAVVSDGAGAGSGTVGPITGKLVSIGYVKDVGAPYTDGVDFTVTTSPTAQTLWSELNVNATKQVAPRQATHSNAGVAALYAAGGTAVNDYYYLREDMITIAVAAAGASKTGTFHVVVET